MCEILAGGQFLEAVSSAAADVQPTNLNFTSELDFSSGVGVRGSMGGRGGGGAFCVGVSLTSVLRFFNIFLFKE